MFRKFGTKVITAMLCAALLMPAGTFAAETEGNAQVTAQGTEEGMQEISQEPSQEAAAQDTEGPGPSADPSHTEGQEASAQTPAGPEKEDAPSGPPSDIQDGQDESGPASEGTEQDTYISPDPLVNPEAGAEPGTEGLEEEKAEEKIPEKKKPEEKAKEKVKEKAAENTLPSADIYSAPVYGLRTFSIPKAELDFRFYIDKNAKAVRSESECFVYEAKSTDAEKVGKLFAGTKAFILSEEKDGWNYVESGSVRGFVKSSFTEFTGDVLPGRRAKRLVANKDNSALTYTMSTTRSPVSNGMSVARETVDVMDRREGGRQVGILKKGDIAYVILKKGGTAFIESGNVRGFVALPALIRREEALRLVEAEGGAENMPTAEAVVEPKDNEAFYYTILSWKEGISPSDLRAQIVDAAEKALGHPYIWGGTDPFGKGADCSGFIQTLYRMFGYSLPRVACDQAYCGRKIDIKDAQAGDLIFFMQAGGYIHHVALCVSNNNGDPQTIEALGRNYGIVRYHALRRNGCWATRIIED